MRCLLTACLIVATGGLSFAAEKPTRGTVRFEPQAAEAEIPEPFRQKAHAFEFEQTAYSNILEGLPISTVTFPSPLRTPQPANNTVHCEYFEAKQPGRRPTVIVLHILGGDFELSRVCCRAMAVTGTHALFIKLPYYGPRRTPGDSTRMISTDIEQTVQGMRQAVLDIRRAVTWLESRAEVDVERIGITGISLGGIVAALSASVEPRFDRACFVLAGGDIARVAWESRELDRVRKRWQDGGLDRDAAIRVLSVIDPITYASRLKGRRVLMLNARYDKVIPPACTTALWEAAGRPPIEWWNAGHYTAALYLPVGLLRMAEFFRAEE
jgi:dienelactone hydrolase